MDFEDTVYRVEFANSREQAEVPLSGLYRKTLEFLEHFTEPHLSGKEFPAVVGDGGGETRLGRLLSATDLRGIRPDFSRSWPAS